MIEFAIGLLIGVSFGGIVGYGSGFRQANHDHFAIASASQEAWNARKKG